jgi:hypothetical protein
MVEYKKKKIILQSGGTRNFYYKISFNGKKKQVSKKEYLEKRGGNPNNPNNNNWNAPKIMSMNNFNNLEKQKKNERNNIKILSPQEENFLSKYNPSNQSNVMLLKRLRNNFLEYVKENRLTDSYRNEHLKKYNNYPEYKRIQNEKKKRLQQKFNNPIVRLQNASPTEPKEPYINFSYTQTAEGYAKYEKNMEEYERQKKIFMNYLDQNPLEKAKYLAKKEANFIKLEKKKEANLIKLEKKKEEVIVNPNIIAKKQKELNNYRNQVIKLQQNAQKELNNAKKKDFPIGSIIEEPEDPDPYSNKFGQSATGLLKREAEYVIFDKKWDSYLKYLKWINSKK